MKVYVSAAFLDTSEVVEIAKAAASDRLVEEPISIALSPPDQGEASLGGGEVVRIVFALPDGEIVVQPVSCIGIPNGPNDAACQEPFVEIRGGANHDVPCEGEPPDGCATPIVLDPEAVAAARPLRLAAFDIPLERLGHHEVEVGRVGLPNGYVTELQAAVGDAHPTDFWVGDAIRLELRPTDPDRPPFGNVYERGTIEGVEEAGVWLVFDVTELSPGAILRVVDIAVR